MSAEIVETNEITQLEKKKQIKYITTFLKFEYKSDLRKTLETMGFQPFKTEFRERYFDGDHMLLWDESVYALARHDVLVEKRTCKEENLNYGCGFAIREKFRIGANVYMSDNSIEITTTNGTKRKHVSDVKRLYRAIKRVYPDIKHTCSSEKMDENCGY